MLIGGEKMKRDKLLIAFILMVLTGIIAINFVLGDLVKEKKTSIENKIKVPAGYSERIIIRGLKDPTSIAFDSLDNMFIAENINDKGRIIEYNENGKFTTIIKKTADKIENIGFRNNELFISQRGAISKLLNGKVVDIVNGLPSYGDYSNNGIAFGYDGMIYICQGAATNSGVVGLDNFEKGWLSGSPYFHDYPPFDCVLGGVNFYTKNPLAANVNSRTNTGAFLPFGTTSIKSEAIKGRLPGNSCILRISPNGNVEDTYAYGIRNPIGITILPDTRVFVTVQGMENRGSRPIANGKDYLYEIKKGAWLGWPDYEGGEPVVLNKFKVKNHSAPKFIMELHPSINPPKPLVAFNESGRIGVMDVCMSQGFGFKSNFFIPLKSGKNEAAKVVAYDMKNNKTVDFISISPNSGFPFNPVQCVFSKSGKLYVLENSQGLLFEIAKNNSGAVGLLPTSLPVEYFIGGIILAFITYLIFSVRKGKN